MAPKRVPSGVNTTQKRARKIDSEKPLVTEPIRRSSRHRTTSTEPPSTELLVGTANPEEVQDDNEEFKGFGDDRAERSNNRRHSGRLLKPSGKIRESLSISEETTIEDSDCPNKTDVSALTTAATPRRRQRKKTRKPVPTETISKTPGRTPFAQPASSDSASSREDVLLPFRSRQVVKPPKPRALPLPKAPQRRWKWSEIEQAVINDDSLITPEMRWSTVTRHPDWPTLKTYRCIFCDIERKGDDHLRVESHWSRCECLPDGPLKARYQTPSNPPPSDIRYLSGDFKKALDKAWCTYIFDNAMDLNTGENPDLLRLFELLNVDWKPPRRMALAGSYLDKADQADSDSIWHDLEKKANRGNTTIICDGWSNLRGQHLLNMLLCTRTKSWLYSCIETDTESMTGKYIFDKLKHVIEEAGPNNIIAICLDRASNNDNAVRLLQKEYPLIQHIVCFSHRANLVGTDWQSVKVVKYWLDAVKDITRWVKAHRLSRSRMRKWSINHGLEWLEPRLPSRTRWHGIVELLKFIRTIKGAIIHFLADPDCPPQKLEAKQRLAFREVSELCQLKGLWPAVEFLTALFEPLLEVTIKLEADKPLMSAVYPSFNRLKEATAGLHVNPIITSEFETTPTILLNELRLALSERYKEVIIDHPLTLIAYLGDPFERTKWNSRLTPAEWNAIQDYLLHQQTIRKSEVSKDWAVTIERELRKLADNHDEYALDGHWKLAVPQDAWGEGLERWQRRYAKMSRDGHKYKDNWKYMDAYTWWNLSSVQRDPQLTELMRKALSICISTGPAERNWSAFGILHSKKRNRMNTTTAGKLTKLYWNRRVRDNDRQPMEYTTDVDHLVQDPRTVLQPHYLMEYKNYDVSTEAQQFDHAIDHTGETTAEEDTANEI